MNHPRDWWRTREGREARRAEQEQARELEPDADDYELAYELLKSPAPFNTSPVNHYARLIADHRQKRKQAHGTQSSIESSGDERDRGAGNEGT